MYKHRKYARGANYDSPDGLSEDEVIPESERPDDDTDREGQNEEEE